MEPKPRRAKDCAAAMPLAFGLRPLAATSAALGNFVSTLINDTLLSSHPNVRLGMSLSADGGEASITWRF